MTSCIAILACHNRRDTTLRCLAALEAQRTSMRLRAVLVDDDSSDGTAEAVKARFGWVTVLPGDGHRYWNGGTHDAFITARESDPDYYLWLNDDTVLDPHAIGVLEDAHVHLTTTGRDGIVAGSVRDPETGLHTYGGVRRDHVWWRPAAFWRVQPCSSVQSVDTMNGNCVLIPRSVVARIGVNDPAFTHGMGDFDYGLRARRAGFAVVQAPGSVGTCPRNPPAPPLVGGRVTRIREVWRRQTSPKGLPPGDWSRFMRRWGGPLWPLFAASPYVKAIVAAVRTTRGRGLT